jgi:hypothetical protein
VGKRINAVDASKFLSGLDRSILEVRQEVEDLTAEMAELGAERMRNYIKTRGTNKTWDGGWWSKKTQRYRYGSTSQRYDSGDMLRAVDRQVQAGERQSRAAFGWIRDFEPYFSYQETGFFNVLAGTPVEGMFALRDARRDVVSALPKLSKKYVARIARRLGK